MKKYKHSLIMQVLRDLYGKNIPAVTVHDEHTVELQGVLQSEQETFDKAYESAVFMEKHPLAPKGWRKWLSKGGKEF